MPQTKLDTDRLDRPKHSHRGALIAVVVTTGAFAAAFAACTAYVAATWRPHVSLRFGSEPQLEPIPVPRTTCPYLRRVHDTASVAGQASGAAWGSDDGTRWSESALLLNQKLERFDLALQSAAAHAPAPIATRLLVVHHQVDVGISQLRVARTGSDWSDRTSDALFKGYFSLSDASDLTGAACGFTVAPSPDVYINAGTDQAA